MPRIPSPASYLKWARALKRIGAEHPEWKRSVMQEAMRSLPSRGSR
jgi:hypothetical protein